MVANKELWTPEHGGRFYVYAHRTLPIDGKVIAQLQSDNDPHTIAHQQRVGEFSALLAHHTGLDNIFRVHAFGLGNGHDCGKSHPEVEGQLFAEKELGIAYSNGANLPRDRWNVIGMHPRIAASKARELDLPDLYVEGFKHHHTPRVKTHGHRGVTLSDVGAVYGPDLVLLTEILQIADSFDSMVNPHYLKEPKGKEVARDEILDLMGTGRYNPVLGDAFVAMYADVNANHRQLIPLAA